MDSGDIKAVHFPRKTGTELSPVDRFGPEKAKQARAFHESFPEYKETPLAELNALDRAGRSAKNVKDLSTDFCYAHGEPVYEVRFSTSEGHYKYTVDAVTGSVMNVFLTV